ncbi:class I SAM-dependent methyltransferase [Pseudomonas sp. 10B1]|uniref:class I SAM-dependent methyltransferase n=1 Tax=unclassified Pseudomonas TaxID=196821 RepID=UPI002AB47250|nr:MULTISPECIES: class I SAM-dependent methyltransferase [unclassified Pseudomonas]MDY7560912.1 class I SAM-dependent methyltransferase [Pseudomonas sp. AB6]MEA9976437.1 class I SAM-dependent methyltransferase [Pseudomonas sp. RTS4]MEA9996952.1 class I SAM-dependent methyltransferase [Pseudomonas sp. AA4]MEB0087009.1 class I SAM-dependent methyltransferase [Pseudomonas sp. RTI1]MEB0126724.1 class I SAM-dependent methyltransferase [Pseudomonas sp. CCC1.2]
MNSDALSLLRAHLLDALNTAPEEARRLFHGRGRRWPGLENVTADWLKGVVLVSLFKELDATEMTALRQMLEALTVSPQWLDCGAHTLLLQHRYLQDSSTEWLLGEPFDHGVIIEHGLQFKLDFGRNQNTGLFLDMRYGRNWVRAHSQGKRVLNLFAYTCGFSVAAIAGGAQQVVNLDMAKAALSRGRENHRLNQHDLSRVGFLGHDLFKSWARVKRDGPYDLIIIDPPSFQKGSFVLTKDYQKILRRLPGLLNNQGIVLACINDPSIGSDFLIDHMAIEAPNLTFQYRLENPPEFADEQVEGGLKALVFIVEAIGI